MSRTYEDEYLYDPRDMARSYDVLDIGNAPVDPELGCCLCTDPLCPGEDHYPEPEAHKRDRSWRRNWARRLEVDR